MYPEHRKIRFCPCVTSTEIQKARRIFCVNRETNFHPTSISMKKIKYSTYIAHNGDLVCERQDITVTRRVLRRRASEGESTCPTREQRTDERAENHHPEPS